MTATDIFLRFLKENGLYESNILEQLHKRYEIEFEKLKRRTIDGHNLKESDAFKTLHVKYNGNKDKYILDSIIKMQSSCLSDIIYLFTFPNVDCYDVYINFHKFLKEHVNGGYYKRMIVDIYNYRFHGYLCYKQIEFSYKDKNNGNNFRYQYKK